MQLSDPGTRVFQERTVPAGCSLAGYALLAEVFAIAAPVRRPACISQQHVAGGLRQEGGWLVFDKRYLPANTVADHLVFAVRHERIDLLILKRVFQSIEAGVVAEAVHGAPLGTAIRRLWFFYEKLLGSTLEVEDAPSATAIDALDTEKYFTAQPRLSRRHRVRDNLLGTGAFCPVIRRSEILSEFTSLGLSAKAHEIVGRTGAQLVSRAASFLLLADSRASFEIEGERAPRNRLERWGRAILQAGKESLTLGEILRLQRVLIEDSRFTRPGLRQDCVFLGQRDHNFDPLPEFIGARPGDLPDLMTGLLEANERMRTDGIDPVLKAAATAFGFVYIHPFQDGNGRMHRCLIHHVLAERRFTPPGMVFPVSAVMLDRIDEYRSTLQAHSGPLMPFIEWRPTPDRNVEVLNDTADFYRYFDCTEAAEFLYGCVRRTVEEDLPREIDYLRRNDEAIRRIMDIVDMPDRTAESLVFYIRQNDGRLSKRRREGEFKELRDDETTAIEAVVQDVFEDWSDTRHSSAMRAY